MTSSPPYRRSASTETTHFGFTDVRFDSKQHLVDDVFRRVADRYDIMNDMMSGGLHRVWKDVLVSLVKPSRRGLFRHLDVAGGTGDVARRVVAAGGARTEVTILDINPEMLQVGRSRLGAEARELRFVAGNAEALPLPDRSYDCYTIAFGIRNVPRIPLALAEAYRTLRRGGHFLCLEFSRVDVPGFDRVYDAFSFNLIPAMGKLIAGDGEPYRYLVESIRRFPDVDAFSEMIAEAGFRHVKVTRLTGGVVAIHSAWKL